jgi:Cytochrome c7 and related cytochrome c
MAQIFAPSADTVFRFALLALVGGVAMAILAVGGVVRSDYFHNVGVAPAQPVPFSHKHHSGELGIDCRYCHLGVEQTSNAGIPPTYTCMTCHSEIWTGARMLEPVRESLASNQPLRWGRVNALPDYVYFNHGIHIQKGVGCTECHGRIDEMQLTYPVKAFRMDFCLNCHRNPDPYLRPRSEIFNMAWSPPSDQAARGAELRSAYHIETGRLSDCSICHR